MKTTINPKDWVHHKPCSMYNRNVYYNEKTDEYIVETCHECYDYYSYDWGNEWGERIGYIGIPTTNEWQSIFDREEIVELDTDIC